MWWVTVQYNSEDEPTGYSVVKSAYMPEYPYENREVYAGPFDTYGDAIDERDSANFFISVRVRAS